MADAKWVAAFEKPSTDPTALEPPATTVLSPYLKFGCLSSRLFHQRLLEIYAAHKGHSQPPVSLRYVCEQAHGLGNEMYASKLVSVFTVTHIRAALYISELFSLFSTYDLGNILLYCCKSFVHCASQGTAAVARALLHRWRRHAQLQPHGWQPHLQTNTVAGQ